MDVVQERGESKLLLSPCSLSYPLEPAAHTFPALCPEPVVLERLPLGHPPSLRRLRRWFRSLVRRLPWYCGGVRLPVSVHHRIVPLGFPMRSGLLAHPEDVGISRFPCKVSPYMRRVFDRAGSALVSRYRRRRFCLPLTLRASAPGTRIDFRGSMAGLHVPLSTLRPCPRGQRPAPHATASITVPPLSTLRPCPRGQRRMTRGRCGSLLLHRMALSSTTPCRF